VKTIFQKDHLSQNLKCVQNFQRQMQMQKDPINTIPLEKFFSQVRAAEQGNAKDVRLTLDDAKILALTLGQINARLLGNIEEFIATKAVEKDSEIVNVEMDGGGFKE